MKFLTFPHKLAHLPITNFKELLFCQDSFDIINIHLHRTHGAANIDSDCLFNGVEQA